MWREVKRLSTDIGRATFYDTLVGAPKPNNSLIRITACVAGIDQEVDSFTRQPARVQAHTTQPRISSHKAVLLVAGLLQDILQSTRTPRNARSLSTDTKAEVTKDCLERNSRDHQWPKIKLYSAILAKSLPSPRPRVYQSLPMLQVLQSNR